MLIEKSRFKDRIATANISASALYHVSPSLGVFGDKRYTSSSFDIMA